jgi:magnesium chelatase family protein
MSLAIVHSRALMGTHAPAVQVEVHLANGLPAFQVVGLPEAEVKESKDRVRAAITNAGFEFPSRRITINLAPADLPKESSRYDLPMAVGILVASGQVSGKRLDDYEFIGELSLSNELRGIRGVLPMALGVAQFNQAHHQAHLDNTAKTPLARALILPHDNAEEAAMVKQLAVYPALSLQAVCDHLNQSPNQARNATQNPAQNPTESASCLQPYVSQVTPTAVYYPDLADVKGQYQAKRALMIAAAGQHSALLIGPPGTGKSMLAQRLVGLLPAMNEEEALSSAALLSLVGQFKAAEWAKRPFRSPHHTASAVALVGGGSQPKPGEISLAHHGVLFLDELPEFDRKVLEVLRQPLESGMIHISRAARQAEFPARFQLIAAMNPCPCGYHGQLRCQCSPEAVKRYQSRLSGPLLDRIDLLVEVQGLSTQDLAQSHTEQLSTQHASAEIATAIEQRSRRPQQRTNNGDVLPNAQLPPQLVQDVCVLDQTGQQLLNRAFEQLGWSARSYHRVLRVARTIADLAGSEQIHAPHVAEAIQFRRGLTSVGQ